MAESLREEMTFRRFLLFLSCAALIAAGAAGWLVVHASWMTWNREGAELGQRHARYEVAHKGWSFPARIFAPAHPLEGPPARQVAEAKARDYRPDCAPSPARGTYCERPARVVPRNGADLEPQFEPLLLGVLVGPDAELREHLPLGEAPPHLIDLLLIGEDREFFTHDGVNFRAALRALIANAQDGGYSQGASTLTMQLVRNLTQRTEKTVWRKLREMALAQGLERALGKEAVLGMYLDAPYLGQRGGLSVCGFQAAARHYFGKDARDLSLAEAATLVAILPAPGKLGADRFSVAALARRDRLLEALAENKGYDVREALGSPLLGFAAPPSIERFPAYLSATRAELLKVLPAETVYGAGLVVETGIDVVAQTEAERLFPEKTRYFEELLGRRGERLQGVGVVIDAHNGLVRALYGGHDAAATGFNRATQARRQPGSAFKPVVFAMAFSERSFTAATPVTNAPRRFVTPQGNWYPRNVAGEYTPTASLAYALAWSQNVATASLLEALGGPRPLIDFATKLGFDTRDFPEEMGLALGQAEVTPLEMAELAGLVANGGSRLDATPILRVTNAAGTVLRRPPEPGPPVLSREAAALTRDLMRLVIDGGTGGAVRGAGQAGYHGPAIGKTGTTDSEHDLWFIGATPALAAVVWLGYDTPARVGATASDLTAPLWGWWMRAITQYDGAREEFAPEPKIVRARICSITGQQPNASCPTIYAPFLPGTIPKTPCLETHPPAEERSHESLWKRLQRERDEAASATEDTPSEGRTRVTSGPSRRTRRTR